MSDYQAYLNSKHWKKIRDDVLRRANHKCVLCYAKATTVHHLDYSKKALQGKNKGSLVPLCKSCHYAIEFTDGKKNNVGESRAKFNHLQEIVRCKCRACSRTYEINRRSADFKCVCPVCYKSGVRDKGRAEIVRAVPKKKRKPKRKLSPAKQLWRGPVQRKR